MKFTGRKHHVKNRFSRRRRHQRQPTFLHGTLWRTPHSQQSAISVRSGWSLIREPHHYTSIDEMLEKEELDILDICLPTYLHVPTAVKAMKKGIHVLSEKPISLKEEDIELAYSTAKENNVCFMIAQVLRFWPEYELIKELYDSGKYGKLLSGYMGTPRQLSCLELGQLDDGRKEKRTCTLRPAYP